MKEITIVTQTYTNKIVVVEIFWQISHLFMPQSSNLQSILDFYICLLTSQGKALLWSQSGISATNFKFFGQQIVDKCNRIFFALCMVLHGFYLSFLCSDKWPDLLAFLEYFFFAKTVWKWYKPKSISHTLIYLFSMWILHDNKGAIIIPLTPVNLVACKETLIKVSLILNIPVLQYRMRLCMGSRMHGARKFKEQGAGS